VVNPGNGEVMEDSPPLLPCDDEPGPIPAPPPPPPILKVKV
jgi:hypothetical protein